MLIFTIIDVVIYQFQKNNDQLTRAKNVSRLKSLT